MARTSLEDALDRLAEAAADVTDLVGGHDGGPGGAALAGVVDDLEDAAGSSLGPAAGETEVALLRRLDRAHRLLLAARVGRPVAQAC
ncbi:hypothetical protein [Aquipuribacter hungaricus]|uniref:Uncharacterized protein n=1 Tax=Aquipuribacter hungaricus TaxID=545624 RepID=A0ABV7WMW6_9MICO